MQVISYKLICTRIDISCKRAYRLRLHERRNGNDREENGKNGYRYYGQDRRPRYQRDPSLVLRGLAKKRTLQIASAKSLLTNSRFSSGITDSLPLPAFPRPQILRVAVPSPRRLSNRPDFRTIRWCKWEFRRQLFRDHNSRGTHLSSKFRTSDLKSQSPNELRKVRVR